MIIYDKKPKKTTPTKTKSKDISLTNIIYLILAIFAIIGIIIFYRYQQRKDNYNYLKIDESQPLIVTRYNNENTKQPIIVPYINISGTTIETMNTEILNYCQEYAGKKNGVVTYEYNLNGKVLSLVIKTIDNSREGAPRAYFKTYNINLDTLNKMSDEEVLSLFNISMNQIEKYLESQFKYYYNDEIKEGYITAKECDYQCFLNLRDIKNYLDEATYYIKNGELIVYRPFVIHSILGEEQYYAKTTFEYQVTSSKQES